MTDLIFSERLVFIMKSTGIVRRLDSVGRLVLPIELRKTLNLDNNDAVEIFTEGESIILKKFQRSCVFCQDPEDLIEFKGKCICPNCYKTIVNNKD